MNKSLITYSILSLLIIFFFGFNFVFSLIGNFLILIFLIPIVFIFIVFLGINSLKSKLKVCTNCGATMIGENQNCLYCESNISEFENKKNYSEDNGGETIEIEAEEIN